jgi:hypothetical protein
VRDGNRGALGPSTSIDAAIPSPQITGAGVRRGPGRFQQGRAQPIVSRAGAGAAALAGALVRARTDAGPRRQVGRRREPRQIGADLRDDDLGGPRTDTDNRLQTFDVGLYGLCNLRNLAVTGIDQRGEMIELGQQLCQQEAVVARPDTPVISLTTVASLILAVSRSL